MMAALENPVLETRHMRLVVALVDEGTTGRAASRLHLTQSAVSHQLTELERRLGFSLFAREKRRLRLTDAGAELVTASRRLLSDLVQTEAQLRRQAGRARARVRISTECYTCYHWLPGTLAAFQKQHTDVDVQIALEATRAPIAALLTGDLDVAISVLPPTPRLGAVKLFSDELVCVMAASHPLASRDFVSATDLADVHLLTYDVPREELSWIRDKLLGDIVPKSTSRVPLTEAILELVRAGMGVSILARWAIGSHSKKGVVARPFTRRGLRRTWRALYAKNAPPHVVAFAKEIGRSLLEPPK